MELFDLYTPERVLTGKSMVRGDRLPDGLWRLYGTKPDNFQLIASAALGTEKNSGRSLVTAAETLYYLSPVGAARTAGVDQIGNVARSAKRLAPVRIRHAQRPVEPRGRISRIRVRPARRRALRAGSERRLALRHGQHGAAGEHAGDGRFRQRQPGLQAPAARAAAAGGGRGRKLATVAAGAKRSVTLPVLPRRCDHFRLRLTGTGTWRLLSLARTETAAGPQH